MVVAVKDQAPEAPSATQIDRKLEEFAGRFLRGAASPDDAAAYHMLVVQRFRPMRLQKIDGTRYGVVKRK